MSDLRIIKVVFYDYETGEQIFDGKKKDFISPNESYGTKYLFMVLRSFVRGILSGKSLSIHIDVYQPVIDGKEQSFPDVY